MKIIATDKRQGIKDSVQQTVVGSVVTLVEIDCTSFNGGMHRIHNNAINPVNNSEGEWNQPQIVYQGKAYFSHPYELSGITYDSSQSPNPTLSLGNTNNYVSALCLRHDDLLNAKVTVITTLIDYLDDGSNPNPNEHFKSTWYIHAKTNETNESVSFKLTTPTDVEGEKLPSRLIYNHCTWAMRGWYRSGKGCGYHGSKMFDKDDNPTNDPSRDVCAGFFKSCRLRFEDNPMDYGGFPSAGLVDK